MSVRATCCSVEAAGSWKPNGDSTRLLTVVVSEWQVVDEPLSRFVLCDGFRRRRGRPKRRVLSECFYSGARHDKTENSGFHNLREANRLRVHSCEYRNTNLILKLWKLLRVVADPKTKQDQDASP